MALFSMALSKLKTFIFYFEIFKGKIIVSNDQKKLKTVVKSYKENSSLVYNLLLSFTSNIHKLLVFLEVLLKINNYCNN